MIWVICHMIYIDSYVLLHNFVFPSIRVCVRVCVFLIPMSPYEESTPTCCTFSTSQFFVTSLQVPTSYGLTIEVFLMPRAAMDVCKKSMGSTRYGARQTAAWHYQNFLFFSGLGLVFCENILTARKKINWGIPNSSRARALLFLSKTLQPKQSAYPSIGQKKLNGASSRMMIYFAMELANRINRDHPSDVNGCWVPKFKDWNIFG